jgi:hypothetical protein
MICFHEKKTNVCKDEKRLIPKKWFGEKYNIYIEYLLFNQHEFSQYQKDDFRFISFVDEGCPAF